MQLDSDPGYVLVARSLRAAAARDFGFGSGLDPQVRTRGLEDIARVGKVAARSHPTEASAHGQSSRP